MMMIDRRTSGLGRSDRRRDGGCVGQERNKQKKKTKENKTKEAKQETKDRKKGTK